MQVKVDPSIQSLSGRWTKNGRTVIALNKKTGKMYQYVLNTEHVDPCTISQQKMRTKFTACAKAASAWWAANKPSDINPNGTEDYKKVKLAYDAQNKYGNIFHFVRSLVVASNFTIAVPNCNK